MNKCEQASRTSSYHDGEMTAEARVEFEVHLRSCPHCRLELEQARALSSVLGGTARPEIPADVLERLHQTVNALPTTSIRRMAWASTAAAAAILVACFVGMATRTTSSSVRAIPDWEVQAVAQQNASGASGSDDQIASWVIQDLSWKE